jgi:predicted nucleic acid-binding protein
VTFTVAQPAVVVDASVTIEVLLSNDPWPARWSAWLQAGVMVLAPRHHPFEVANGLLRSVRLAALDVEARLDRMQGLGIETSDLGWAGLISAVDLADRHGLTVYDAAYLELAISAGASLATIDNDLRRAARAERVDLVEDRAG